MCASARAQCRRPAVAHRRPATQTATAAALLAVRGKHGVADAWAFYPRDWAESISGQVAAALAAAADAVTGATLGVAIEGEKTEDASTAAANSAAGSAPAAGGRQAVFLRTEQPHDLIALSDSAPAGGSRSSSSGGSSGSTSSSTGARPAVADMQSVPDTELLLAYEAIQGYNNQVPAAGRGAPPTVVGARLTVAQRMSLEVALLMAQLLNRTLVVPPMAPHRSLRLRPTGPTMRRHDIVPAAHFIRMDEILDWPLLSARFAVRAWNSSHRDFTVRYIQRADGRLRADVHRICHNPDWGFWLDRLPPAGSATAQLLVQVPYAYRVRNALYRNVCAEEFKRLWKGRAPVVRGLLDELDAVRARMVYAAYPGTYIELRYVKEADARNAQQLLRQYLRYHPRIRTAARLFVERRLPSAGFGALHVRRGDFNIRQPLASWMRAMRRDRWFRRPTTRVIFVSTEEAPNSTFFAPLLTDGYDLVFMRGDEPEIAALLAQYPSAARMDIMGMVSQLVCVAASRFIGTITSTFSGYIYWMRGQAVPRATAVLWLGDRVRGSPFAMNPYNMAL